jgi:hypothetical protein
LATSTRAKRDFCLFPEGGRERHVGAWHSSAVPNCVVCEACRIPSGTRGLLRLLRERPSIVFPSAAPNQSSNAHLAKDLRFVLSTPTSLSYLIGLTSVEQASSNPHSIVTTPSADTPYHPPLNAHHIAFREGPNIIIQKNQPSTRRVSNNQSSPSCSSL